MAYDEYYLYGLHRESSPNGYGCSQDTLEVGWGDSPEPLKIDHKLPLNSTPIRCKKKLEPKESPRSSNSFRNRRVRTSIKPPAKPPVDVAKYIAELQELSKNIVSCRQTASAQNESSQKENQSEVKLKLQEVTSPSPILRNADPENLLKGDESLDECLIACTQSVEVNVKECTRLESVAPANANSEEIQHENITTPKSKQKSLTKTKMPSSDSSFDRVLQSFNNEEDDWLSQVVFQQETKKTPGKGNFVKSRSENHLVSPCSTIAEPLRTNQSMFRTANGLNNNFRRTCSSDMLKSSRKASESVTSSSEQQKELRVNTGTCTTMPPLKKQKSFMSDSNEAKVPGIKCSIEEIEKKRLEAKYRKERKEIERKKLEAMKRLEMKKSQGIKTLVQHSN